MEAQRLFILLLLLSTTIAGALREDHHHHLIDNEDEDDSNMLDDDFPLPPDHFEGSTSWTPLMNGARILAQRNLLENYTCDEYPRVCRQRGSGGRDCCKKKCVNVMTDNLNCYKCGLKCGQNEKCCRGTCVKIFKDNNNCGGCNIKCHSGRRCDNGMCGYA